MKVWVAKDTFYRERRGARWVYWTYSDGVRVTVSEAFVKRSIEQGDKLVTVR